MELSGSVVVFASEDEELTRAKSNHAAAITRLDDTLEQARRSHRAGVEAAHRKLLGAYQDAILRALDAGDKQAVEQLRQKKRRIECQIPRSLETVSGEELFECVLGMYGQAIRGPRCRFVNLRPPNRDLWADEIRARMGGKISFDSIDYVATAKLVITEPGWYTIDLPETGTQFRLNNMLLSGGDVELSKGVYDVEIYTNFWGQPYLKYASAAIRKKGIKKRIPLVNTGGDIGSFLEKRVDGRLVVEVSGHKPQPVDVSVRLPKGKLLQRHEETDEPQPLIEEAAGTSRRTGAIMHGSPERGLAAFLQCDHGQFAVGQPISLAYGIIAVQRPADDAARERIAVAKPLPAIDPHNGSWFSVIGPDERELPYQGLFVSWAANRSDQEDSLGPGELVGRTSELNLSFDFSRPGQFRLQWHYGWDGLGLVSNEIQIEIVPADGAALGAAANNGCS